MCMCTALLIIIEGQFQAFQRFSSSKLALKAVVSCFVALDYYENGSSTSMRCFALCMYCHLLAYAERMRMCSTRMRSFLLCVLSFVGIYAERMHTYAHFCYVYVLSFVGIYACLQ